ncbi:MAG: LysE family transporter [Anaerolineales bacterium]|nr:LysE family transporter [Anaerolineales bacterium]
MLRGLIIGFSIAAPVGPIGVLCIRRTLTDGRVSGLVTGLGAASADAIYGIVAAFGLVSISNFLIGGQTWLRLVGGIFLCYLGIRTLLAKPSQDEASIQRTGLAGAYASTFILTLTNPLTILSFAAVFAGMGLVSTDGDYGSAVILVLGVFFGSALWWFILVAGVSIFRERFNASMLRWVNIISGVIITAFGLVALLSLI